MSQISITPSTPPRSSTKSTRSNPLLSTPSSSTTPIQQRNGLVTPSTVSKNKNSFQITHGLTKNNNNGRSMPTNTTPIAFKTPSSIQKKKSSAHLTIPKSSTKLLPSTPDYAFTPRKSPISRKRKVIGGGNGISNDIINDTTFTMPSTTTGKISFGLLLPAPSKIGSGRQQSRLTSNKDKIFLSSSHLFNDNHSEFNDIFHEQESEEEMIPQTPSKQLINDNLVNHWHGKSYNNYYSSDEDELPTRTEVVNPFINNGSSSTINKSRSIESNPFTNNSSQSINYDTHMELINNKTGHRRVVKLTSNQSKIKPKKLDFSGL
ncbi:uncharacterized protein RJT21DRAFT_121403 [Scheffersomyces amazonensis]|uniref:uncharacterized protein n=1 Tax=Scheffersomyces amazonensis TaxID=1078765 RepID=UPI00315D533D